MVGLSFLHKLMMRDIVNHLLCHHGCDIINQIVNSGTLGPYLLHTHIIANNGARSFKKELF